MLRVVGISEIFILASQSSSDVADYFCTPSNGDTQDKQGTTHSQFTGQFLAILLNKRYQSVIKNFYALFPLIFVYCR
jgi:hypothetical protein